MKKFLFPAFALILAAGTAAADGQSDAELQLEKEAAEFEKRHSFQNEQVARRWQENRKATYKLRREEYQKAAQQQQGIIPAVNPPECTYYSTEGVCILPRTLISPYPKIAHVNTLLDFKFPRILGSFTALRIMVYTTPELGYSIKYFDPEAKVIADVYIYDLPAGAENVDNILVREIRRVAAEINSTSAYRNVRIDEKFYRGGFQFGEKPSFLFFLAEFDSTGFTPDNKLAKCQSFALLFAKNGKFVKIRITRAGSDRNSFVNIVNAFLGAFDQKIILDSQTRTRKFRRIDIPPIVMSNR